MLEITNFSPLPFSYETSGDKVTIVDVLPMKFLMVAGAGDSMPKNPHFQLAAKTLRIVAKKLKTLFEDSIRFPNVDNMPFEALWWPKYESQGADKSNSWLWTALFMLPDEVTIGHVYQTLDSLQPSDTPLALTQLKFQSFCEGTSLQILHEGDYDALGDAMSKLSDYAKAKGLKLYGKRHEIYLNDPWEGDPDFLDIILRYPYRKGKA